MSFSEGVQAGFGLVNDVYDRREKKAERQAITAERQAVKTDRSEEARLTAEHRSNVLTEQIRQGKASDAHRTLVQTNTAQAGTERRANEAAALEYQRNVFDSKQEGLGITRAAQNDQLAAQKAQREREEKLQAKLLADQTAAMNATAFLNNAENASTEADYDALFDNWKKTQDSLADVGVILDPIEPIDHDVIIASMNKLAAGEEVDDKAVVNAMDSVLKTSAKFQEGTLITPETHPAAGEEFYNKGFTVVGIQTRSALLQDDSGQGGKGPYLKPTVTVTVEDGQGRRSMYLTNMTEGRQGGGAPVRIYTEDLVKANAARINYYRAFTPDAKRALKEAIRRQAYSDDGGNYDVRAYEKARLELSTNLLKDLDARQVMDMPVTAGASMTWAEFSQGDQWEDYVEHKLLIPDNRALPDRDEVDLMLSQLRDHPAIKKVNAQREKQGRKPLDEIELSQASVFFKTGDNFEIQLSSSNAQQRWFNKMSILGPSGNPRMNPSEYRASANGRGSTPKSKIGYLGAYRNVQEGGMMTEVSIEEDGVEFPLMVPTLTQAEINTLQNMNIEGNADNIPESIKEKARVHMRERLSQGLSPFYGFNDRNK